MSPEESSVMSVPSLVIVSRAILPTLEISRSPKSKAPPTVSVPDISTLPFISISVALSSISSVAFMSSTVALGALINCDASLNWIAIVLFNNSPVSATCVSVTSLSAPKPSTAASLSNLRSLLTVTAVEALMSTVGAVISNSVSASMSSCPSVLELINIAVSRNCIFSVDAISKSSENSK